MSTTLSINESGLQADSLIYKYSLNASLAGIFLSIENKKLLASASYYPDA